ncbi:MAG: phosphatase PAP2 family protein [Chloroflexi bacterium]|nr:phosphatase PAP2 family protein [Chloroflexota bacterium]
MDDALVIWLNEFARRHRAIGWFIGVAAERLAGVEVGLMLLLAISGRRRLAVRMLAVVALVYAACEGLGRLWQRERPFERLSGVRGLLPHEPGRSFPSRHVASGLAMASIGGGAQPRLGLLMGAVAWLLGLSRVAAGLHYPSDVAAGAVLGIILGRYARDA